MGGEIKGGLKVGREKKLEIGVESRVLGSGC